MNNILKRSLVFFFAALFFVMTAFSSGITVFVAEEKPFTHSAYNFEYDNPLLDIGDGNFPLLPKDGDYDISDTGRNGSKASSNGAVLSPELFSDKTSLTVSFWVDRKNSLSSENSVAAAAESYLNSLEREFSALNPSAYTQNSFSDLDTAIGRLRASLQNGDSNGDIVDAVEAAMLAKDVLQKVYLKSESASVLFEIRNLDSSEYTEESFEKLSAKADELASAIADNSDNISELTAEVVNLKSELVYIDYLKQANSVYTASYQRYTQIPAALYSESSLLSLKNAISLLKLYIDDGAAESSCNDAVTAVEKAFDNLEAADDVKTEIFGAYNEGSEKYITLSLTGTSVILNLNLVNSGTSLEHSLSGYLGDGLIMFSLIFQQQASGRTAVSMYVNGDEVEKKTVSGRLSDFVCREAAFSSYSTVDDIYLSSKALSAAECKSLYEKTAEEFLASIDPSWVKPSDRINVNPVVNFKWSAYTFDNGLKLDSDLNGVAPCSYNAIKLASVDTSAFGGQFRTGLARRNGVYPLYYISLDGGLLYSADSFTFSAYVYNQGTGTTTASLFEFSGKGGKLVFSPFSSDSSGNGNAYMEYTDASGNIKRAEFSGGRLGDINSKWSHYAFVFASNGDVTVYVNGKASATVNTGVKLSSLSLTSLKVVSGITEGEGARLIIDDVYISSKPMTDSDIRKLAAYGVERFVGEVLPDPETGEVNPVDPPNLDPDETDALEDNYSDIASINGYVGTTFDDTAFMGEDYNGSVSASVRNASLVQGLYKYGLNLNGKSSYLRYPMQIFDSLSELTVSIAYNWADPSQNASGTQKLFFFSNKKDSVSDPNAYMYLDMGNGGDGIKFCVSDGDNSEEIPASVNVRGEWKRLTVTVKDRQVKIYLDTDLVAQKSVDIDFSKISPNFNYIGKSGYKGDPLFCGVVDEIYISDKEITEEELGKIMSGIVQSAEAQTEGNEESGDIWDAVIIGTLIFMGLLVAAFIGFIVYIIFFKK